MAKYGSESGGNSAAVGCIRTAHAGAFLWPGDMGWSQLLLRCQLGAVCLDDFRGRHWPPMQILLHMFDKCQTFIRRVRRFYCFSDRINRTYRRLYCHEDMQV